VDTSLDELVAEFDPALPLERARSLPSPWYADPRIAALERERVFGASWQLVARADQLERPGDFVTTEVAGEPLLVLRDDAGELRAFFNVCRHRAACVMTEPQGNARRLRCRYHGWTYDLRGQLRGLPEFEGVEEFRREEQGLVPVHVDRWGPMVFVHLGEAAPPLGEWLAPLPAEMGTLEGLRFLERREYTLACNWKVFVDNYLDGGYHVNTVHPALAGVLDYTGYKTTVFANASVQTSPMKSGDPNDPASRTRTGSEAAYWWVFPNFMLNLYSGVMDTNLVLPMGPDRCKVIFDYYFARGTAADFIDQSVAVAHQVQIEDVGICEEVQRGLHSRSYTVGRFSVKREAGGYHFHQLLANHLAGATIG
jgi:phenylpropionate dioxygenase-like ring-hydroxylating dioxygenase large terminal subunit